MPLVAEIRPEERRAAYSAFLTLFGIIASHTVLETARDALFLARLPASQLPWVYLVMAAAAVVLAQVPARGLRERLGRYGLASSLATMSGGTFVFWLLPGLRSDWGLRGLYVWSGLVATLSAVQFWLVLGEIFTITQAKRVYRLVGVGSLLGAVGGAAVARLVSGRLGAEHLILVAAVLMLLTAVGPAVLLRRPEQSAEGARAAELRWTIAEARELVQRQPYVTRLAAMMLVSTVAVTLGDYVFKNSVAKHVPASELGEFFAGFYMILNVLALLAQFVLMGVMLRTVGLHRSMWLLPVLLFLGAIGVVFGGGLPAALLLKGADGTLRHSVHRTGTELLYLPIPDALRARVKPLLDVFGQRGGQATASVFILAQLGLGRDELPMALAAAALSVVWIAAAAEMVPHYVQMFRQALREGMLQEGGGLPELDLNSLEALFSGLNSSDDREVIGAMELLVAEGRGSLIPALILYHPSRNVVLRALSIFETSGRRDFVPIAGRLLQSPDPEIRSAALRAHTVAMPDEGALHAALADESPLVRATAAVGLVSTGATPDAAHTLLQPLLARGQPEWRRAIARAIERRPAAAFEKTLQQLALAPEMDVQTSVANAMGALRDEAYLPALLTMIARHEVRGAAGRAFVAFGAKGLAFLDEALADHSLPHEIRRQIPRTIRGFPARDAARALQKHLLGEQDGMVRFKILRALNRLSADNPGLGLDRPLLRTAVDRTLGVVFRLLHWQHVLVEGARERPERATPGHELLLALLRDKEAHAAERVFRLLGLLYRNENFKSIHRGVLSSNRRLRASSRELLEAVLKPPLRDVLLAIVDRLPWPELQPRAARCYLPMATAYEDLLLGLLEEQSETVRCLAAHHVAELGLVRLRPAIEARRAHESALFVARVLEKALRMLDEPVRAFGHAG
jgi:ATP/ADP translocase